MSFLFTLLLSTHAFANELTDADPITVSPISDVAEAMGLKPRGVIIGRGGQEVMGWSGTACVESARLLNPTTTIKTLSVKTVNIQQTRHQSAALFLSPGESTDLLSEAAAGITIIRPTNSLDSAAPMEALHASGALLTLDISADPTCEFTDGEVVTMLLEGPIGGKDARTAEPPTLTFGLQPAPESACRFISATVGLLPFVTDSYGASFDFALTGRGAEVVGPPSFQLAWDDEFLQTCLEASRTGRNPQTRTGRNPQTRGREGTNPATEQ